MEKREYWAWISSIDNMYYNKISKLIKVFDNPQSIYEANTQLLMERAGIDREDALNIIASKDRFDVKKYFDNLKHKNINFVTVDDDNYPEQLVLYRHKPYYLFYKGKLPESNMPSVAIVGARACSNYGRNIAKDMAKELSQKGVQIISGMARGIDTYSQLGAVEGGSPTFAVLGCGVDVCYPTENIELYKKICKKGGIISEYAPGKPPLAWHFPQRNRIISGLADKLVVVEAKEKSGSLITVEWALEQGKDIMAVPGRVGDPLSSGCNRLIKSGAGIVISAEDILEELKYVVFNNQQHINIEEKILEKDLSMLYSELSLQPKNIYELMDSTGLDYEVLVEKLLVLQLQGMAEQPSENYYSRLK